MNTCLCGCGQEVKVGRRYISPSHALQASRDNRTPEHNAKIGLAQIESNIKARRDGVRGKVCPSCKEYKTEDGFGYRSTTNSLGIPHLKSLCYPCALLKAKNASRKRSVEEHRKHHLRWRYGITHEEYERMLAEQGGGCAVCGSTEIGNKKAKHFHVDHCHTTGKVRGLLCSGCNTAIGQAAEDPARLRALADYVEVHIGHRRVEA